VDKYEDAMCYLDPCAACLKDKNVDNKKGAKKKK
jgi:hypothetical protein